MSVNQIENRARFVGLKLFAVAEWLRWKAGAHGDAADAGAKQRLNWDEGVQLCLDSGWRRRCSAGRVTALTDRHQYVFVDETRGDSGGT